MAGALRMCAAWCKKAMLALLRVHEYPPRIA